MGALSASRLHWLKRRILALPLLAAAVAPAAAQSTWNGATSDYNTNSNWTPATAPVSPGQSAVFAAVGVTNITVSAPVNPDSWTLTAAAQAYTFAGATVTFATATGLINNSNNSLIIANTLAGIGMVTQNGTNNLIFDNTNTYSGGSLINAGTIAVAHSSGGVMDGLGSALVTLNGGTLRNGTGVTATLNNNVILGTTGGTINVSVEGVIANGTITGTGPLTVTGGTLTLVGAATHTGATIINPFAVVAVGSNTALAAGVSGFQIGANATFNLNTFNATVGSLSDVAGLGGTVTKSSASIPTVTLTVGTDNTSTTFSGVIGGGGNANAIALVKTGTGTQTLAGANPYFGGTTINAGTLAVAHTNGANQIDALGTGAVTLNGGTLLNSTGATPTLTNNVFLGTNGGTINTSATGLIVNGTITGAGALTITGGQLTANGTMTNTGSTTINSGATLFVPGCALCPGPSAFRIASGGTFLLNNNNAAIGSLADVAGAGGTVRNAGLATAVLTIGGDHTSTTFSGVIGDGAGVLQLIKLGGGTLTLTGANTYTGITNIDNGTLAVNGSLASSLVQVSNSGILGGIGTVRNTILNNGGTLSPGNSIGTLTVNGTLTFNAGSQYVVEVSPTASDKTIVTGTASLTGGTVLANFAIGAYLAKSYTILQTAGLGGTTFAGLNTLGIPAGFSASLSYTATDANLSLVALLGAIGTGGLNVNQQNVASALNTFFNNGGTLPPDFVTLFGLTGANLANALT